MRKHKRRDVPIMDNRHVLAALYILYPGRVCMYLPDMYFPPLPCIYYRGQYIGFNIWGQPCSVADEEGEYPAHRFPPGIISHIATRVQAKTTEISGIDPYDDTAEFRYSEDGPLVRGAD